MRLHEVEVTAREAERDRDEAQEELGVLEPRLAKAVDLETAKAGIARVCEISLAWYGAQEVQALDQPLGQIRTFAARILGRIRKFSQLVGQAEQAAGRRLNIPRIGLPIEALETLTAAESPTLEWPPEPPANSPPRAPAHGLTARFTGPRRS